MNKKVVQFLEVVVLVIIILISIFIVIEFYPQKNKQNNDNINIILNENKYERMGEENILKVIIDRDNTKNKNITEDQNSIGTNKKATDKKGIYYIKVNNQTNTVTIYDKDEEDNYTIPIKAMICSIGEATPESGVYSISDKYKWATLEGHVYGQYATRIVNSILFHSVPYIDGWKDSAKSSIEWWEYDKLGTKASLGCVRLTVEDAKWIYENCEKGTKVEFYYDNNPGPLGKPTAKKISEYPDYLKGWDPTDPDYRNPWRTYKEDNK